ncbi:hypothetical protein WA026_019844 [Henosepilachna vigintioctopunctata]|uniref:Uncharacterized protein n=1 Tax=Henosepilachna vigintioctopunctata TaxID=420089 RepID=A0AAW1VF85_9CUCU
MGVSSLSMRYISFAITSHGSSVFAFYLDQIRSVCQCTIIFTYIISGNGSGQTYRVRCSRPAFTHSLKAISTHDMSNYRSVGAWLKELRENIEYYEPLSIYTSPSYEEQIADDEQHPVLCKLEHDTKNFARKRLSDDYENIWDSGFALPVYFAEERIISVFLCESVEDLKVPPVKYETVDFEFGGDVMLWRQELRFDCQEEESILESEVIMTLFFFLFFLEQDVSSFDNTEI